MSDETNRAVQAPTHAATAVIYGADANGVENRGGGGEERDGVREGDLKRSASLTHCQECGCRAAMALIKHRLKTRRDAREGHTSK